MGARPRPWALPRPEPGCRGDCRPLSVASPSSPGGKTWRLQGALGECCQTRPGRGVQRRAGRGLLLGPVESLTRFTDAAGEVEAWNGLPFVLFPTFQVSEVGLGQWRLLPALECARVSHGVQCCLHWAGRGDEDSLVHRTNRRSHTDRGSRLSVTHLDDAGMADG